MSDHRFIHARDDGPVTFGSWISLFIYFLGYAVLMISLAWRDSAGGGVLFGYSLSYLAFLSAVSAVCGMPIVVSLLRWRGVIKRPARWRQWLQRHSLTARIGVAGTLMAFVFFIIMGKPITSAINSPALIDLYNVLSKPGAAIGAAICLLVAATLALQPIGADARRRFWLGALLTLASLAFSFIMTEAGLSMVAKTRPFYVHPPRLKLEQHILSLPGVSPVVNYTINSLGVRGMELNAAADVRILAMGASAADCAFLDDQEAWPQLIGNKLNQQNVTAWVGNAGKSALRISHQLTILRRMQPVLKPDILVLLIGVNDFLRHLRYGRFMPEAAIEAPVQDTFASFPFTFIEIPSSSWIERTNFWKAIIYTIRHQKKTAGDESREIIGNAGDDIAARRKRLQETKTIINVLPDLAPAIAEFEQGLELLVAMAKERNITPVLLTQPAIYSKTISGDAHDLLWLAFKGETKYPEAQYTQEALVEGMEKFNARILSVCERNGLVCVDLAKHMNGAEEYFYDDVHFNAAGASKVAELVVPALIGRVIPHIRKTPSMTPP